MRLFGDIRAGSGGPRLSVGQWPHVSVDRLMHEGQYRLPEFDAPPQACTGAAFGGRLGIALVRIPAGEETKLSMKTAPPPIWIF